MLASELKTLPRVSVSKLKPFQGFGTRNPTVGDFASVREDGTVLAFCPSKGKGSRRVMSMVVMASEPGTLCILSE